MPEDAVVVGAGLAGAVALTSVGYDVRILERNDELRATGAGLTLWPNAAHALKELGLGSVIDEIALPISEAVTLAPSGRVLMRVPLERLVDYGPLVSADRGELLNAIAARTDSPIEFGAAVRAESGRLVSRETELAAALVVGADGVGSATRELIAPRVQPRAAGYAAWRGIAELGAGSVTRASETMGRGKRFRNAAAGRPARPRRDPPPLPDGAGRGRAAAPRLPLRLRRPAPLRRARLLR
jgi:2-polyprenyl-6-methoxyphenol hydroxylase-like FAD-dependent oxidoreductase